jgi:ankyrin repeat protein
MMTMKNGNMSIFDRDNFIDMVMMNNNNFHGRELITAVRRNCTDVVTKLINHGCNVNLRDDRKSTPLMWTASGEDNDEIAIELINGGCDIDLCDNFGLTALMYAVIKKNMKCIIKLIEAGCNIYLLDTEGAKYD